MGYLAPNPSGKGGVTFKPGTSGNPGGRPKSNSRVQIAAMNHALEAVGIVVGIARTGGPGDAVRLAASREILDRAVGKAAQHLDLDLTLSKRLNEMSEDELLDLRDRYAAAALTAPAVAQQVERVEEQDRSFQTELGLDPVLVGETSE
jgi:hypothetical protein